jgi:hypothetical protein
VTASPIPLVRHNIAKNICCYGCGCHYYLLVRHNIAKTTTIVIDAVAAVTGTLHCQCH